MTENSSPVNHDGGKYVILAVLLALLGWGILLAVVLQW